MKLSIIIPCFNEESRIIPTLQNVASFLNKNDINAEILVIDDGSTDATELVAFEALKDKKIPFKVIRHKRNIGKGQAIATGIKHGNGDYFILFDADESTPITELPKFYQFFNPDSLLIGAKESGKDLTIKSKVLRGLEKIFHKIFFNIKVIDRQSGFKIIPKSLAISFIRKPFPKRYGFDIALIYHAKRCGFKIIEIGVIWNDIPKDKENILKDTFRTFVELLVFRFNTLFKKSI